MDISDIRRARLAKIIDEQFGGVAAHLAAAIDRQPSYVSRMKYPPEKKGAKAMGEEMARHIEKCLDMPAYWLDGSSSPQAAEGEALQLQETLPLVAPTRVPVVGTVQGGDEGYLLELDYPVGHGDGSLSHYSKDLNAYGLRVKGDSMRPRIKPGEFIVCEPNKAVNPGDDVMVALIDGRRMVKELLWRRDGEISFGSVNDAHHAITVQEAEIEKMHYVAAIMPRGAFSYDAEQDAENERKRLREKTKQAIDSLGESW